MSEMWEASLTFKREEREGIVPVGTYLSDAAGRFGLRDRKCVPFENVHFCRLSVLEGEDRLSGRTAHETDFLAAEDGKTGERLGCQTKIVEPGEIVVMTEEKKEESPEETAEAAAEKYAKDFADLPLEKKMAQLVNLEAIALGETVSFVINSPYLIFGKVVDILAEFGLKKEEDGKNATRPAEHVDRVEESVEEEPNLDEPVEAEEPGKDASAAAE